MGSENSTLHLVILGQSFTFGICLFSLKGPKPQIWPRKPDDLVGRSRTRGFGFLSLAFLFFSFFFFEALFSFLSMSVCLHVCLCVWCHWRREECVDLPHPRTKSQSVSHHVSAGFQSGSPARATSALNPWWPLSCLSSPASFSEWMWGEEQWGDRVLGMLLSPSVLPWFWDLDVSS